MWDDVLKNIQEQNRSKVLFLGPEVSPNLSAAWSLPSNIVVPDKASRRIENNSLLELRNCCQR